MRDRAREFALGQYDLPEGAEHFFRQVDGLSDPMSVLGFEDTGIQFADGAICRAIDNVRSSMSGPMIVSRSLRQYIVDFKYMADYRIQVLEQVRDILGVEAMSVLDPGCGQGRALTELRDLPCVDADKSVGIGLPRNFPFARFNRHMFALNMAHTVPHLHRRFDVVMSMFGAVSYHPFNISHPRDRHWYADDLSKIPFFGPLQILNFMRDDSVIFDQSIPFPFGSPQSVHTRTGLAFAKLREMGILSDCPELRQYQQPGVSVSGALRLQRRPTQQEVCDLLGISEETHGFLCL